MGRAQGRPRAPAAGEPPWQGHPLLTRWNLTWVRRPSIRPAASTIWATCTSHVGAGRVSANLPSPASPLCAHGVHKALERSRESPPSHSPRSCHGAGPASPAQTTARASSAWPRLSLPAGATLLPKAVSTEAGRRGGLGTEAARRPLPSCPAGSPGSPSPPPSPPPIRA